MDRNSRKLDLQLLTALQFLEARRRARIWLEWYEEQHQRLKRKWYMMDKAGRVRELRN